MYTSAEKQVSFFDFITIATTENIKKFFAFTATKPESEIYYMRMVTKLHRNHYYGIWKDNLEEFKKKK